MRISCPCCRKRFDVPHREVLAEAARLAEKRKGRSPMILGGSPLYLDSTDRRYAVNDSGVRVGLLVGGNTRQVAPEPNGNILSPADAEGKRERAERLARRGVKP